MAMSPAPETVWTVLQLTRHIRRSLEEQFPAVWVRGEVTGCRRPASGHAYFTLKEGTEAVLECALYRNDLARVACEPQDGLEVEAFGTVSVFEPRGRYQLMVKELRPAGIGRLLLELEKLKKKLAAEGLFEAERKRPLPRYPTRIGVVTSQVGAAVRDIVTVARARWPSIGIVLAPVRVQGLGAADEIAAAISRFDRYGGVDLVIVGRGGGSLEDLWAFNEEAVVRAIAGSRLPIVSAVGHEVDVTLADLAADVRAATPSNAAEIAVPVRAEETRRVAALLDRMTRAVREPLAAHRRRLEALVARYGFRRRRDALAPIQQRVDDLLERATLALAGLLRTTRERLRAVQGRYGLREWPRQNAERKRSVRDLERRLEAAVRHRMAGHRAGASASADRLRALSPRLVLERGFCIVRRPDGSLIRTAAEVAIDDAVTVEFARGEADARITEVRAGGEDER